MNSSKFSSIGAVEFERGDMFINIEPGHDKNGNFYVLVRESRPEFNTDTYCYNLLNLETGKMRFTEEDRAFWASEPITMTELTDRFGTKLYHVGHISDSVPLLREFLAEKLVEDAIDPREMAMDALVNAV